MSLDITLYEIKRTEVFDTNITHNLAEMAHQLEIYKHLWRPEEIQIKNAGQLIEPLKKAIAEAEAKPDLYKFFSAKNGWGTYEQFIPWLKELLHACEENPNAEIEVSR